VGSEARTRLAFGGVLLVLLLAFGQLFGGDDYLGPALLGTMAATGLSMLCRRLGAGPWLTGWVSLTALAAYLCIVFQPGELFFGLPAPRAAAGIVNSITSALDASSADFAPVPLRPGYVIMTVAGMWACATLGEIATFRWRRPLLASVGPTSLVAFLLIVGRPSFGTVLVLAFIAALLTYWALESTHRLRSWGRWVGPWTNRETEPEGVTGRVARRMGLGAVAAAIVAPLIVPALGSGLLTWRTPVEGGPSNGAGAGAGAGGSVTPLVDLQPRLIEQTDAELFRVRAEAPSYWRLVSLSDFDGRIWSEGDSSTEPLDGTAVGGDTPAGLTRELEQSYELTGLSGEFAPAAERPVEVLDGADQFEAGVEAGHLAAIDGDVSENDYTVRSLQPALAFDELSGAEIGDLGESQETYLGLPDDFDGRIRALAERWTRQAGAETDFETLIALQDRFQNSGDFVYSQNIAVPPDDDGYLYDFLTEERQGYCQQYATAFAAMSRSLGYPTRVSVGFLPGNTDPEDPSIYIVRGTHAHAWPEVYFADLGWVRFEPTPRDISPELAYTRDPGQTPAGGGAPEDGIGIDGRDGPRAGAVGPNCPPGLTAAECAANLEDPGANSPERRTPEDDFAWQERFAVIWRAFLAALAAFIVIVPALKELRTRRRYRRARSPSEVTAAAFSQFIDEASELALVRSVSESAIAYATRLGRRRVVGELQANRLAHLYEEAEYSSAGSTEEHAAEARGLARSLRSSMWSRASWWMRLRRLFSPAGLLAARRSRPRARARLSTRITG